MRLSQARVILEKLVRSSEMADQARHVVEEMKGIVHPWSGLRTKQRVTHPIPPYQLPDDPFSGLISLSWWIHLFIC